MNPTYTFLFCLAALAGLAAGVVFFLRRPLEALLRELCGGDERARFWARTYYAALFLGTLFSALVDPPDPSAGPIGLLDAVATIRAGFLGLLGALGVLAVVVMKFIVRGDRERRIPSLLKPPGGV